MQELELHLANKPHKRPAGDGLAWIRAAWGLFKQRWGMWTVMLIAMMLVNVLISFVLGLVAGMLLPESMAWLGQLLTTSVGTLLVGGWIIAAASLVEEDDLSFSYLFTGFQYKFKPLLILGLFLGGLAMLITFLTMPLLMKFLITGQTLKMWALLTLFTLPISACGLSAVPLVVLHDIAPHRAIGMSVHAFLRNWLPLLVSGLVWLLVLLGVVVLVLGAGMVVGRAALLLGLPVVLAGTAMGLLFNYTCYRNIWTNLPMK